MTFTLMATLMQFFLLILSLSIYVIFVLLMNEKRTRLVDSSGMSQFIPSEKVFVMLGIGWAAFGLSLIFNILYYALHPSQVTLITLICLQSSLISLPGRPAGHQQEAGCGCGWIRNQSAGLFTSRSGVKYPTYI